MRVVLWVLMAVGGAGCAYASTASRVETRETPTPASGESLFLQELREQQAALRDRVMPEMRRHYVEGEYARALELLDDLVKRGVDDLQVRMAMAMAMASAAQRLGQHETALRHARAAYAHARREGDDTTMTGLHVGELLVAIGKKSTLSPAAARLVGCVPTGQTLGRGFCRSGNERFTAAPYRPMDRRVATRCVVAGGDVASAGGRVRRPEGGMARPRAFDPRPGAGRRTPPTPGPAPRG